MTFRHIDYIKKDMICTLRMNHSLTKGVTGELLQEINEACGEIIADTQIKAVVITGSGDIFAEDSGLVKAGTGEKNTTSAISIPSVMEQLTCPVIAAINGNAIGTGLELALACDIRMAVESARFRMPHISDGDIPHHGGTQLLPRIVGKAKAIEMILTGEILSAQEAYEAGLITRIVTKNEMPESMSKLCSAITAQSAASLKHAKEAVIKGLDMTLEQGLRLEGDLYFLLHTTEDRTEGIRAFLEKRQPHFKGK